MLNNFAFGNKSPQLKARNKVIEFDQAQQNYMTQENNEDSFGMDPSKEAQIQKLCKLFYQNSSINLVGGDNVMNPMNDLFLKNSNKSLISMIPKVSKNNMVYYNNETKQVIKVEVIANAPL